MPMMKWKVVVEYAFFLVPCVGWFGPPRRHGDERAFAVVIGVRRRASRPVKIHCGRESTFDDAIFGTGSPTIRRSKPLIYFSPSSDRLLAAMGGHSAWRKRVARGEPAKGSGGAACRHHPRLGRKGVDQLALNRLGFIGGRPNPKRKKTKHKTVVSLEDLEIDYRNDRLDAGVLFCSGTIIFVSLLVLGFVLLLFRSYQ